MFEASTGTDLAAEDGVYVVEVMDNSAAKKAGIQAGDVIVKVGNDKVSTMSDLNKALYQYSLGDKSEITVNRGGKEVKLQVNF